MANRRFEVHEFRQILFRIRQGDSDREIARSGLAGRPKVKALREVAERFGWLTGEAMPADAEIAEALKRNRRRRLVSTVEPYREEIERWSREGVRGTVILEALRNRHGYEGSYSAVKRFVRTLSLDSPRATTWLEYQPGEAAQVDFGKGPEITDSRTGEVLGTWIFVMTLCFSRHMYAELVRDQKVETWLGCHRRAFEFFGGVPSSVIIDNPKCAITRACYRDPVVQRGYEELAEGYGFKISPCPVRDPKKKGRVESGVKYVKGSFVPLRQFRSLADGNEQLQSWVLETAGNRLHGTTKERPLTLFGEVEKALLRALPARAPEIARWTRVKLHGNCHVQFEKSYYSAPYRLVHQGLWLKATPSMVQLYRDHELVATHVRAVKPGSRSTVKEHLPPEALAYAMRDPVWCRKQAERIGPRCAELIHRLLCDRVLDRLRAAQGIVGLAKKYGDNRLENACERALSLESPQYRTVKRILERGLDQLSSHSQVSFRSVYLGEGRYCRDTKALFH